MSLADQLDWVAKYRVINGYRERHGLSWRDPKLAAMDLQYHDVRPERSLYARLGDGAAARPTESVDRGHDRAARRPPGPTSGASACSGGARRSPPPTGTRWSSTSAPTRSGGFR